MTRLPIKPKHRGSHQDLACSFEPVGDESVDAIIVPTIRRPARLRDAFELGEKLGCPVLVLSSRWSSAAGVDAVAAGRQVVAIDVVNDIPGWPRLRTATIFDRPDRRRFAQDSDLSLKRNLGLVIARMAGWEKVLFLDDDIVSLNPADIAAAAAGLATYEMVALRNFGFPDNSVVCHALRNVGKYLGVIQHSFVGGGALSVAVQRSESFFPNIYNEDWFFMLGHFTRNPGGYPLGKTGRVCQTDYDPFLRAERARVEELGDCLAEGLFALLGQKETIAGATLGYWREFLEDRRRLLEGIRLNIPRLDIEPARKRYMDACIQAAQGRNWFITPELCVEYLASWQADTATWQDFLENLPHPGNLGKALEHLGLRVPAHV